MPTGPTSAAPGAPSGAPPRPAGRFGGRPGPKGGRFQQRRKVCAFCADKTLTIDYKDSARLGRFISDRAKIDPRRRSGTCARHQRALAEAIKQARFIALLPYVPEHIRRQGNVAATTPVAAPPKVEAEKTAAPAAEISAAPATQTPAQS